MARSPQGAAPLALAAFGAHAADQLVVAALPLAGALTFGLDAATIGLMAAAQSAAWLIGSAPAGWLLDHTDRRLLAGRALRLAGLALAFAALCVGLGPTRTGPLAAAGLTAAVFLAAAGPLVFVLAAVALAPGLAAPGELPRINARLELARALATLAAPPAAGALAAAERPAFSFALASLAAFAAARTLGRLPAAPPRVAPRAGLFASARAGAGFVAAHPLLRPVALCAIFWNLGFFGLVATFAPAALAVGLTAGEVGLAQSAMGAGLLAAALAGGRIVARAPPRRALVAGPAVSIVAALAIVAGLDAGAALPAAVGYALLGFGPTLWAVTQTTLRQLVTPPDMLGRAGAAVQLAIYGVRPIGAALAGAIAARWGASAALLAVALLFTLSTATALASPLARLRRLPAPQGAPAQPVTPPSRPDRRPTESTAG